MAATKRSATKPSVMYMVGPKKDQKLIDRYNAYRVDPKKDNVLISSIYNAADVTVDSPIPKKMREQVINDRGFSTESFVEMLLRPKKDRPSTFQECVDFFYPHSGVRSRQPDKSPFISTFIGAYSHSDASKNWGDRSKNTIPPSLGEVSMMYGWFMIYRLMLCPRRWGLQSTIDLVAPDKLFSVPSEGSIRNLNKKIVSAAAQASRAQIQNLALLKTAVGAAAKGAQAYAASGGGIPSLTSFEQVRDNVLANPDVLNLLARGTNAIVDLVSEKLGFSKGAASIVTSYMIEGVMKPKDYAKIFQNRSESNVLDCLNRQTATELQKTYGLTQEDAELLVIRSPFAITGEMPGASVLNSLSDAGKAYVRERSKELNEKYTLDFLTDSISKKQPGNVRPNNPLLIGLGISLAEKGINAYLDAKAAEALYRQKAFENFYRSTIFEIDPNFSEDGFTFGFETYENDGLLSDHPWMSGMDMNKKLGVAPRDFRSRVKRYESEKEFWKLYPTCSLQNGGEMINFWTEIYRRYRPVILDMRTKSITGRVNIMSALDAEQKAPYTYPDIFPCKTFNIFYRDTLKATKAILKNLPAYSPFTHAFGFAPTILFNDKATVGYSELNDIMLPRIATASIFKKAPEKIPDMMVIGAPTASYFGNLPSFEPYPMGVNVLDGSFKSDYIGRPINKKTDRWFPASPGTGEQFTWVTSAPLIYRKLNKDSKDLYTAWTMNDLQNSKIFRDRTMGSSFTVNSQRLLNDSFGGVLSLGFDTALDLPIFNAQWAAMMSVLFCYPEALDTIAAANIPWAVDLKRKRDSVDKAFATVGNKVQSKTPAAKKEITVTAGGSTLPSINNISSALSTISNVSLKTPLPITKLTKALTTPVKTAASLAKLQPITSATTKQFNRTSTPAATEEKKSNTGIYIAAGTGVVALAGLALWMKNKKK